MNINERRTGGLARLALILVLAAAMILSLASLSYAGSKVTISGGDSVKGGDTFTVTVKYSGGNIGMVSGEMSYDTGKLTYLSGGSSSGNTGYIELKEAGDSGSITFNLKFQAKNEGTTSLKVSTYEMYDLSGDYLDNPSASKTVSVSGSASEDQIVEEEAEEGPGEYEEPEGVDEKPAEEEEEVDTTAVLLISAAVLLVIIGIISAVLIRKRKHRR